MHKKALSLLLAALLCAGLTACGNSDSSSSSGSSSAGSSSESAGNETNESSESTDTSINFDEDPYEVHFMYVVSSEGANQQNINDCINELTLKELNMTVDAMPTSYGVWTSTIATVLAANEDLDVMPILSTQFPSFIEAGYLVNLYDYIDYLQGAIEQLGDGAYCADVGGFLCGFTEMKEWGFPCGLFCRTDILEELGVSSDDITIDPTDYSSFNQITELFTRVANETDYTPFGGTAALATSTYSWFDGLGDTFGVLGDFGQDTTVVNWYESDQFYQLCNIQKNWFDANYCSADIATNQDGGETLMKAGNLFSYISYYKPNSAVEKKAQTGYDLTIIPITPEGIKMSSGMNSGVYALSNAAEDKTKAAQFLNFVYTNGDINDLINWGEPGVDWVVDENGQATFPEGVDATTVQTHNDFGWIQPNQFVAHAWAGNALDVWDQYREYNDSMTKSVAYGFVFDSTVVTDQSTQCNSVLSEYQKRLAFGTISDLEGLIAEFNEKLYAAGLQDIIDAKQSQLDAWLAENA